METIGLVVAAIAALAAVVGAVVAISQAANARQDRRDAETARDASREARDDAIRLAGEANEAFKRQAVAQERANEIEEAKLPKHAISFEIVPVQGDTWAIVCTDLAANDVIIKGAGLSPHRIVPLEAESRCLHMNDTMRFMLTPATMDGRAHASPRIRVEFVDPNTGDPSADESDIVA